jgi:hypothetical protein
MRKYTVLFFLMGMVLTFSYCNPSKKSTGTTETMLPPKSTYESGVAVLIQDNCSPCHIPSKGGFKKAYDNYASVKTDIDEIIRRIELNPAERGFMPFKKTVKLSDSTISAFKKWRDDGLLEK